MIDEKGNISIYLIIVLTSLLLLIFSFLDVIQILCTQNEVKILTMLGINDVLCDYNYELKRDYNLLGIIYQSEYEIENEIYDSLNSNINFTKNSSITIDDVKVIEGTKLSDINELKRQILIRNKNDLLDQIESLIFYDDSEEQVDNILNEKVMPPSEDEYDSIIHYSELDNRDEIYSKLNSVDTEDIVCDEKYITDHIDLNIDFENAKNDSKNFITKLICKTKEEKVINDYIMKTFCNVSNDGANREKVFDAEIEFIISGSNSQYENVSDVKNKIIMTLYPEKLIEVYSDDAKKEEASLIAEAVCGWWATEIGVTLCKNVILNAWALDMCNDCYNILIDGGTIETGLFKKQMNYNDFLNVLLLSVNDDIKLLRINNLIEMNLKKYNFIFSMDSTYTNIDIETTYMDSNRYASRKYIPVKNRFIKKYEYKVYTRYGY